MEITVLEYPNFSEVRDFYLTRGHNSKNSIEDDEKILIAKKDGKIIGAVRLCKKDDVFLLRTMEISPDFQRQGIGSELLLAFEKLLGNNDCYCISYTHLESFYGQIGFQKIQEEKAPQFLYERVLEYRSRESNKGKEFIILKKSKKKPSS